MHHIYNFAQIVVRVVDQFCIRFAKFGENKVSLTNTREVVFPKRRGMHCIDILWACMTVFFGDASEPEQHEYSIPGKVMEIRWKAHLDQLNRLL
jgi:hypothetical protein